MEKLLYDAALEGSVSSLRELIQQDPLILDRVILNSQSETPLHVAAMLGHLDFVNEILQKKPELTGELDSRRSSPLHLASAKGYLEIVKSLLLVNPDMCFARDAEGRNPLHLAAMKGRINALKELVAVRPHAARATAIQGETILHICVKSNQLEALKFLVETLDGYDFLNSKDDYGFTILHLVVIDKQVETINFLLSCTRIQVNEITAIGLTPLDVLAQSRRDVNDYDIAESLRAAGAVRVIGSSIHRLRTQEAIIGSKFADDVPLKAEPNFPKPEKPEDWLTRKRDSLMVVASLIATMAFQSGVVPPGGFWQEDTDSHMAGKAIMADRDNVQYAAYLICNMTGLISSMSIVLLLVTGLPFKRRFFMWLLTMIVWVAIISLAVTYILSIRAFTPSQSSRIVTQRVIPYAIAAWSAVMAVVLLAHTLRIVANFYKKLEFLLGKRRRPIGVVA